MNKRNYIDTHDNYNNDSNGNINSNDSINNDNHKSNVKLISVASY